MRRVTFNTLTPTVTDSGLNSSTKNGLLNKKKSSKTDEERSLRFEITISSDQSTNDCPEFSYKELIKDAEEKDNQADDPDSVRERAEEDEVKKLAKSFEAKYGAPTKKKRKFNRKSEDYIDKGYGYDENDSFIDNEEAYDELIPSTMTTKYGGFYINFGKLEFRACSDIEDEEDDSRDFLNVTESKKRKNKSHDQSKKKRKKVIESDEESNSREEDLDNSEDEEDEEDDESANSSEDSLEQQLNQNSKLKNKKATNNSNKNEASIETIIEKVINQGNSKNNKANNSSIKLNSSIDSIGNDLHKIPDEFPNHIKDKLTQLKVLGLNQANKKQRSFIDEENKLLFEIDNLVQTYSSNVRNQVNSWLINYLNLSKPSILSKRINNVRRIQEDTKLKQNISKLRMEVSYLIEEYEDAYIAKVKKWENDRKNGLEVSDRPEDLEKEFKFNDSIRDLLKKILISKRALVSLDNIKGKQEEDNITNFFNNEIKNIWPINWISNSTLLKTAGFISKYSQTSDLNKTSVSVISNKKSPPVNPQQQALNLPKTSQQQQSNSNFNSHNNAKVKQSTSQQPKDLSIDKSNKHDKSSLNKSESLLIKQQNEQQSKPTKNNHQASKSNSSSTQEKLYEHLKSIKKERLSESNLQISYNQLTSGVNKLANLEQIQKQFKIQQLAAFANQQNQQQQQQKSASSQQQSKIPSFDKAQNMTNYVVPSSSPSENSANRPYSSSNHQNSMPKKFIEQQQFSQQQKVPSTLPKQSINKSLEVDFNMEKSIKKSLIDDSNKSHPNLQQMNHHFQRSNSLSNSNVTQHQPVQPKSLAPKPAHSNTSTSQPSTANPAPNPANLNYIQQLQIMQQYIVYNEAIKKMHQSGRQSNDLSSLNSRNSYPSYNTGNNQTQISNQSQISNQQISQSSQTSSKMNASQPFVQNSSANSTLSNPVLSNPVLSNSVLSNSVLSNPILSTNASTNQINSGSNLAVSSNLVKSNTPQSNPLLVKNEFDMIAQCSPTPNIRYTSPSNPNSISTGVYSANYQANTELASSSNNLQKGNPIYSDYMNLSPQIQQQLYQRNIQRQDDSKRK